MKKFGTCKILKKFDSGNSYEVELLDDMDISPIFNVANLYKNLNRYWIIELVRAQGGKDYYEYLMKWKNRPIEDASLISQAELDLAQVAIYQ